MHNWKLTAIAIAVATFVLFLLRMTGLIDETDRYCDLYSTGIFIAVLLIAYFVTKTFSYVKTKREI